MNKKIIIILLIVNTAILLWGVSNYIMITGQEMTEVQLQISETPPLAIQSLEIIESYTEEQKNENVNKIIHLYSNIVKHLDATEGMSLEIIDTLYDYMYFLIAVSIVNILLALALFLKLRHNKALNTDSAKDAAPVS